MPSFNSHVDAAARNQATIDFLVTGGESHTPWIITVAFYKALHVIEAILAAQTPPLHHQDHTSRGIYLKTNRRFEHIYRNYSPLQQASMVMRYLHDESQPNLTQKYMSLDQAKAKFLDNHLRQICVSANRLMGRNVFP